MSKPNILTDIEALQAASGITIFDIVTVTRSTSDASGTQAVTGVGFEPSVLIAMSATGNVGRFSVGLGKVGTNKCINSTYAAQAGSYGIPSNLINMRQSASGAAIYTANVISFDEDGFTLDWIAGASAVPGETITAYILAIK